MFWSDMYILLLFTLIIFVTESKWLCCVLLFVFSLLGMFAELQRATVSFIMSVRPSTWENLAPTEQIFIKFDIFECFWKTAMKIKISLKCDKNNRCFIWRPTYIYKNISNSS